MTDLGRQQARDLAGVLNGLTAEQTNAYIQDNDEIYSIELTDGQQPRPWKLIREKNLNDL